MSANTKIEWADHTFNPWIGCTKVSPACDNCYAEADFDKRRHVVQWGAGQPRKLTSDSNWAQPLRWNANAQHFAECPGCGRRGDRRTWEADIRRTHPQAHTCCPDRKLVPARPRVFCSSLADVFDNEAPVEWRRDLFNLIRRCENLDFLLLTKRVGNVTRMLQDVASMLRSEHGAQAKREPGLQAGTVGRTGDRRGGSNLAHREADVRSLDRWNEGDTMRTGSGGTEDAGRLPAGASDDRRQAALRGSVSSGVASLQGADPARAHGEPQGRGEGSQPPGQPGTGDLQRAEAARGAGAGRRAPRREGVESPEGTGVGGGCGVDEAPAGERLASEGHRGTLRHHAEVSLAHLHREDLAARLDLLAWIERWLAGDAPPNVWIGATICNQEEADRDIPKLLAVPAARRFLSIEPLLGPVDLHLQDEQPCTMCVSWNCELHGKPKDPPCLRRVDWIIVGESGPNARPMHPDWARSLRNQCQDAGVPFLFKQWGEWSPGYAEHGNDLSYDTIVDAKQHEWPEGDIEEAIAKAEGGAA